MAKITAGRPKPKQAEPKFADFSIQVIELGDPLELTEEETEHIRRVFESIREQLDIITAGC